MQNVLIVGSKGIPGSYGGYETFVDKLTEYHQENENVKYHVACKGKKETEFEYHNARCFQIKVPDIGPVQAIYYDLAALKNCCTYIKNRKIEAPVVYILACRVGPFARYFHKKIKKYGGKLYVNPDGHEWMRAKWSKPVRQYWKLSERLMVKNSDLMVCDSKNIENYIQTTYSKYKPQTTFIAYGTETRKSLLADESKNWVDWYRKYDIQPQEYYLVVGRAVPENNYKTMLNEFRKSHSKKDLVVITNVDDKFLGKLESETAFSSDSRIKFVGTVYDSELLMKIRENAFGYFHGHEVGGTNPSLLEALGSTKLNLLLDVGFNREVALDGALYWTKEEGSLSELIHQVESMEQHEIDYYAEKAKKRIEQAYSWQYIADKYAELFQI